MKSITHCFHLSLIPKVNDVSSNVIDSKERLSSSVGGTRNKVDDILMQVWTETVLVESTMEIGTYFLGHFIHSQIDVWIFVCIQIARKQSSMRSQSMKMRKNFNPKQSCSTMNVIHEAASPRMEMLRICSRRRFAQTFRCRSSHNHWLNESKHRWHKSRRRTKLTTTTTMLSCNWQSVIRNVHFNRFSICFRFKVIFFNFSFPLFH